MGIGDPCASGRTDRHPKPFDPNDKIPPAGFGPLNHVSIDAPLEYKIDFENLGPGSEDENGDPYPVIARAPAQMVSIEDELSPHFDWTSVRFTEFRFGDTVIPVTDGSGSFSATVPVSVGAIQYAVQIDAMVDVATGVLSVFFQAIDPATGLPPVASVGVLPPEDGTGAGMGLFKFTIMPMASVPDGTQIRNIAVIRFDSNDVIPTNQVNPLDPTQGTDPAREALVTIDTSTPSSSVAALPATSYNTEVLVNWSGTDGSGSSGVGSYDVYVSTDGGAFALWQDDTAATQATFSGLHGHSYAFYTVASDNVGHTEAAPPSADAQVSLVMPPWLQVSSGAAYTLSDSTFAVAGGTATFTGDAASTHANLAVNVSSPGTLALAATQHVAGLSLAAGATATMTAGSQAVLVLNSLQLAAGARLDLTDNDLALDYSGASPTAGYEALVASGYNLGDWAGAGITSSIAMNDNNYTVAIADNALLAAPFGTAQGGSLFGGVDVDLDTVLIKFTHRADLNLDGLITPDDSAVFGGNYDENQFANWATGDLNFDGLFTPDDSAIFGGSYDESLPLI